MSHHPGFHFVADGWLTGALIATALAGIAWTLWRRQTVGGGT